jgi:hypothetical protein
VLQNGNSYVSAKLTIRSSEGLVEIEHEPITNYNKRVIATFPIQLSVDIKIGESKEILLNSIIPKSLRFDADDSGNVIYLHPVTASANMGVEGFCNSKKCREIEEKLAKTNARLSKQETRPGGTMSNEDYAALAARIAAMNGGAGGAGADDGGELVCTPITDSEDNAISLVGVTTPLSGLDMARAAENSVYHQAAINVVGFIGGFFILSRLVNFAYTYIAAKLQNRIALIGFELLCVVVVVALILTIYLAFIKGPPRKGEGTTQKKKREQENLRLTYTVVILTILLLLFSYLIYDNRRQMYSEAKAKGILELESYKKIFGDRDCYTLFTYMAYGMSGWVTLYKQLVIEPLAPDTTTKSQ